MGRLQPAEVDDDLFEYHSGVQASEFERVLADFANFVSFWSVSSLTDLPDALGIDNPAIEEPWNLSY